MRKVMAGLVTAVALVGVAAPVSAAPPEPATSLAGTADAAPLRAAGGKAGQPKPAAGKAGRPKPTEASLVGSATLWRPTGDDIRFAFDTHGFGLDVRGTFEVSHYLNGEGAWVKGKVDCLVVGGKVAVVTGVITESSKPEWIGVRRGMTVFDNGRHDRVGYSWVLDPGSTESVPQCVSGAPYEWVETGDFRAVEWFPFDGPPSR